MNFEGIKLVSDFISHKTMPDTRVPGWDRAFEELESADADEQAFARRLGFDGADEYRAAQSEIDRCFDE